MTSASEESASPVIAVDVGGSKTALGILDTAGRVSHYRKINNRDANTPAALLEEVSAAVGDLRAHISRRAETDINIGVAICELVSSDGEICSATSIPWARADVVRALSPFGHVTLEADVRASALAEAQLGAGAPFASFVHVTIGTGISCCLVRDRVPDAGAHGFAGLIGSAPVTIQCPDGVGNTNVTLEEAAAGPALARRYATLANKSVTSAEDVFALADSGDTAATATIQEAATLLGSFVALLVNLFDPDAVVIGGGLGSAGGLYWDTVISATRAHIWTEHTRSLPIQRAFFGPDAALVGAGLVAQRTPAVNHRRGQP